VDVCLVIKRRLEELGLEQKDLASASEVTESYRLSKLAELQRREELKRDLAGPPAPMFGEIRELIVRKCVPGKTKQVRAIFEQPPFGELERV